MVLFNLNFSTYWNDRGYIAEDDGMHERANEHDKDGENLFHISIGADITETDWCQWG